MDILAFLDARITEDETEARRQLEQLGMVAAAKADLRAFAECKAKRKIIAHHERIDWDYEPAGDQDYMEKFLFILAEVYADHPDYNKDWEVW
ncbi:hypothetical protein SRABI83_03237 [Arthrobacter sp. Bi83]|uniref:DUF6221 family protein n=1 Tax=Arthrobacter sp. Bi83 TaxID=2822353 RepID=UPI001D525D37|nr:DUF6221 family protein [Arthrobacter sp. Bi83]CAH0255667.1 hypothetical protein SRABI83_03237 [Arthrobacter sp. Bi83]